MKVKDLIEQLMCLDPETEVKLHHHKGNNALFVKTKPDCPNVVVIEDKNDFNMPQQLNAQFVMAESTKVSPSECMRTLKEIGFTYEDIVDNFPHLKEIADEVYNKRGE